MSVFTEAKAKLDEGISEVETWIPELRARAAAAAEAAAADVQKYENEPLVAEITKAIDAGLHIPDNWVGVAIDFLTKLGALAGDKTPAAPAAPEQPDPAPAEPAPAQ